MAEGYWVIRTYEAGQVGEKIKFWCPGKKPTKSGRRERAELKKQEQNGYACLKNAARVLNANFREGDLLIGLDYSDEGLRKLEARAFSEPTSRARGCASEHASYVSEPAGADAAADSEKILRGSSFSESDPLALGSDSAGEVETLGSDPDEAERMEAIRQAAEKELINCLRRVKRELQKAGIELRYHLAITSDMDGDTGEQVRVHHHLVVNREAREAFFAKWTLGGVFSEPLAKQKDYTPLAEYLLRQVRRVKDEKKYTCSRNLIRPQPRDRVALSDAEVRVPKGGELLFRGAYRPGQPQYIRYVMPEKRGGGGRAPALRENM